jgi:hypothetical protein
MTWPCFFPFRVTVFHMWLIRCFELQVIATCLIQVCFLNYSVSASGIHLLNLNANSLFLLLIYSVHAFAFSLFEG